LTIILCALFIGVIDCSIRVSQSFTGREGGCSPLPSGLLHLYDCDYEIYNIVHTALLSLVNPSKQSHHVPHLHFIIWKEDALLPAMFNLLCSSTNQQLSKKNFCNQSSHYENNGQFNEAITCLPLNWHFSWWPKMNGTQRRAVLSPWRTHCMYNGMAKGASWAEATSNSKKIRLIALAVVELHESEGIRQAGS